MNIPSLQPKKQEDSYNSRYETKSSYYRKQDEDMGTSSYSNLNFSNAGAKRFLDGQKPKQQVSPDKFADYVVGKKVRHTKFGEGVIVAVKNSSAGKVVDVAFKGVGVKSLSVQFAPMQLL